MKNLFSNFNRLLLLGLAVMTVGNVWGGTTTCTFSTKAWKADNGGTWTSGIDGNVFLSGRGVQVTSGTTGANGTSGTSFTNVSQVVVTYSTNKSSGAGSIAIKVGTTTFTTTGSVSTSGGTSDRTLTYTGSGSGTVTVTVTCSTNSIYVKSVAITTADATPTITTSASSLAFGNVESGSNKSLNTLTVSGANLTNDITYAISGTNASFFSVTSPSSPISKGTGTVSATTITVKYAPTSTGSHSAKLTFSSTGATAKEVTLTGTGTAPACTTSPTVSAGSAGSATTSSLTFNCSGGITTIGSNCSITSYGYVWGTSENPTISNSKHEIGTSYASASTAFAAYTASGLNCGTTYYMRPYATNGNGTAYGTQASASTSACPVDVFIDNMHSTGDFASPGKSLNAAYTKAAITIADKTKHTPTDVCLDDHYHFVGWITAATKSTKNPPYAAGDLVSFNESNNTPTGTTYYAVWAKEQ